MEVITRISDLIWYYVQYIINFIAVENSSYQMRKVRQPKKVRQQKKWGNKKSEATQKVKQLFIEDPEKEANF